MLEVQKIPRYTIEMDETSSSPPKSFVIPSLHDNVDIECRIYHPKGSSSNRGAIVAHPYGPLGGSFDDIVVQTAASELIAHGYTVGTFNFRYAYSPASCNFD
jgi:hypothetical protein